MALEGQPLDFSFKFFCVLNNDDDDDDDDDKRLVALAPSTTPHLIQIFPTESNFE